MSAPVSHAAALMSADQYRQEAQKMLAWAETWTSGLGTDPQPNYPYAAHFIGCAQVYALLAISAQAAENREDVPF